LAPSFSSVFSNRVNIIGKNGENEKSPFVLLNYENEDVPDLHARESEVHEIGNQILDFIHVIIEPFHDGTIWC